MNSLLAACALLSLTSGPDDFVEPPMLEISGPPPCNSERDCFSDDRPLCDTNTGECVQCLGPEQCNEGWICGPTGDCLDACEVDADCEGVDGQSLCDTEAGTCVECRTSDDCPAAQYCTEGSWCRDDHCGPGETFCFGDTIMLCLEDGGSTMEVETCEGDCEGGDGAAQCVAPPASTGEPGGTAGPGDSTAGEGSATTSPGDGPTSGGTSAGETAPAGDEVGDRGCACRSTASSGSPWAWSWGWLLGLGAAARRRSGRAAGRRAGS